MNAAVALRHVVVIAVVNKCAVLLALYAGRGCRSSRRQRFPVILVHGIKPVFWGVAELADAPGCFPGSET